MFAILETGSKQYKVEEGDVLEVELLNKEQVSKDNKVKFDSVLLVHDKELHIGQPFVEDARIQAKVLEELKAPKVIVFKKKSKKQYKRTRGHRQQLHRIEIEKIEMNAEKSKTAEPKEEKPKAEKPKTEKTVAKAAEPKEVKAKTEKPKTEKPKAAKKPAKKAEKKVEKKENE